MVVSKKIARLAVQRNYMKRVLRELFRTQCQHFQPVDLVIRPQKAFGHAEYPAVASEFRALLARIPPTLRTHILDNSD